MARFDDLAAFAAVVREGSFTRAAAQLGGDIPRYHLYYASRRASPALALVVDALRHGQDG